MSSQGPVRRAGFRLGEVAGVEVRAAGSVGLVIAFITWSLATSLPSAVGGYGDGQYTLAGIVSALLLMASIIAHEVGHAVLARRNGLRVQGINLWLLGGVTTMDGRPQTPGAQLRISAVGPGISLLIGVVAGGLAGLLAVAGASPLVVAVLVWLAGINAILGVFNLLPASPLDGGKVLAALLWSRSGERIPAQRSAAGVGIGVGIVLISAGALLVTLAGWFLPGIWIALVGMFVQSASMQERRTAQASAALDGLSVGAVMRPGVVAGPGWWHVEKFYTEVVTPHPQPAYPVLAPDGTVSGLVSAGALARVPVDRRAGVSVRALAGPEGSLVVADPHEPALDALARAAAAPLSPLRGWVVVADAGRVVGILGPLEVAWALQQYRRGVRPARPTTLTEAPDEQRPRVPVASVAPAGSGGVEENPYAAPGRHG